ncbi:MAG: 3-oxoacyl-[acyl-carrier-protein] reductase [Anaerolineaceae bacterium]|nr:3-oxoacyl-[acyl-carrier-protein] reductase [Anaerolineaceae bacterium]
MEDRVALITGASRGIGKAIAIQLASLGARVAINYRTREQEALAVEQQIRSEGGVAKTFAADVSQEAEVQALVSEIVREWGPVEILVNNAGITRDQLMARMKTEEFDVVMANNLRSAWLLSKACLRNMLRARYGRIINISSVSALMGNAGQTNYAASKAGLIGMSKSLAREVASRGITVNVVAPGFIETEMTASLPESTLTSIRNAIPMARFGQASDVAAAVAFLASDGAQYITGQTLSVDGGMYM